MATPTVSSRHDGSSSPLPSLEEILQKIKKPNGVSTGPLPNNPHTAHPMYTTASSFTRQASSTPVNLITPYKTGSTAADVFEAEAEDVSVIQIPAPGGKKTRRKAGSGKLREVKTKRPETPEAKDTSKNAQPWRKYKSSKPKPNQDLGKLCAGSETSSNLIRSHHFAAAGKDERVPTPSSGDRTEQISNPLPAVRRRLDWTPPPPDKNKDDAQVPPTQTTEEVSSSVITDASRQLSNQVFANLHETYGRADVQVEPAAKEAPEGIPEILKKRKAGEPAAASKSRSRSPAKKTAKKKPRTITDKATSAYAVPLDLEQEQPSLSAMGQLQLAAPTSNQDLASGELKGKSKRKPAKSRKSKAAAADPQPSLLSPAAAIRYVDSQDFLFGTSSQLARETSPTLLRDLHAATKASNRACNDSDPFLVTLNSDEPEATHSRKKLWEVGSRDDHGMLLDLPVIDLVDSPAVDDSSLERNPFGYFDVGKAYLSGDVADDDPEESFPDLQLSKTTLPKLNQDESASTSTRHEKNGDGTITDLTPPQSNGFSSARVEQAPPTSVSNEPNWPRASQTTLAPRRPDYDRYTDAQLASEVGTFGFKSIKRRQAMIALLHKCWESKHGRDVRAPLSPLPSNQSLSTSSALTASSTTLKETDKAVSPKRPRGRPRKDATSPPSELPPSAQSSQVVEPAKRGRGRPRADARTSSGKAKCQGATQASTASPLATDATTVTTPRKRKTTTKTTAQVIEIPDSESDEALSLVSPAASPSASPAGSNDSLSLDDTTEVTPAAMHVDDDASTLMTCITKVVRMAPRTQNPLEPSWHEQMLMYDPVILEDLTAWLNAGQLSKAGYDGEVSPTQVKQWCESKSVCCLWRVNLSGKERKRY